jgi:hypothetical protein
MGWRIGAAALGVLALGLAAMALDQRRQRRLTRLPRSAKARWEIDRWEAEGGAPARPRYGHETAPQTASAMAL